MIGSDPPASLDGILGLNGRPSGYDKPSSVGPTGRPARLPPASSRWWPRAAGRCSGVRWRLRTLAEALAVDGSRESVAAALSDLSSKELAVDEASHPRRQARSSRSLWEEAAQQGSYYMWLDSRRTKPPVPHPLLSLSFCDSSRFHEATSPKLSCPAAMSSRCGSRRWAAVRPIPDGTTSPPPAQATF